MAMRWKKNQRPKGLARVASGDPGSTLRIDGDMRVATVSQHRVSKGWYWVAGWEHPNIPHKNTCNDPPQTEAEAKADAIKYVRANIATDTQPQ